MTEFNALINDNFKKLPYAEQSKIAGNFFDKELSNDNFRALPAEEQTRIRGNFLASTFREAGIAPAAPPEQGPSFSDFANSLSSPSAQAKLEEGYNLPSIAARTNKFLYPVDQQKQHATPMGTLVGLGQLATTAVQAMPMNQEQVDPESAIANFISEHIPALGGKAQSSAMPEEPTISQGTPKPTDFELFKQVYKDKVEFAKKTSDVAKGFAEPFVGIFNTYKDKGAEAGTQHIVQQMALDPLPVVWAAQIVKSLAGAGKVAPAAAKIADEIMAKATVDDMIAAKKASAELDIGDFEKQFESVFGKKTKTPAEVPVEVPTQEIDVSSPASQGLPLAKPSAKPILPSEAPKAPVPPSEPPLTPKVAPEGAQAAEQAIPDPLASAKQAEQIIKDATGEVLPIKFNGMQERAGGKAPQGVFTIDDPKTGTSFVTNSLDPEEIAKAAQEAVARYRTPVEPTKNAIAAKRAAAQEAGAQFVPKPAAEPKPALTDTPEAKNFIAKKRAEAAAKAAEVPAEPPAPRKSEVPPPSAPLAKTIAERRKPVGDEFTADRKALLAQVDEKMPKASSAEGYETVDWEAYNRLSRKAQLEHVMPDNVGKFGTVTFETPSGVKYEIANHKKALEAFKKRVSGGGYKPETMPESKPVNASGARIKAEEKGIAKDVEYYNEYRPRKSTVQAEKTSVDVYEDGIYSNGYYGIKTEKPVLKKSKYREEQGATTFLNDQTKAAKEPARIAGEFVSPHTKEGNVQAHIVGKKGTEVIVNAEYVDKILTKYPNATAHVIAPDRMVVFKEGDKMVGFVMPQIAERGETGIEAFFGKSLKPRANEVLTGKGMKPTQLMSGAAGAGLGAADTDENGKIRPERVLMGAALGVAGMKGMGIAGKVKASRAAIAEKMGAYINDGRPVLKDFVELVKSAKSHVPAAIQQAMRSGEGIGRDMIGEAGSLGKTMHRELMKTKDQKAFTALADAAQRGNKEAFMTIAKQSPTLARELLKSRVEIDFLSDAIIKHIKDLYPDGKMPLEWGGQTIPAGELVKIIEQNKGAYLRRDYMANHIDRYKPNQEQWDNAIAGYIKDHPATKTNPAATAADAREFLERELERWGAGLKKPGFEHTINKSPFMARENSPQWLRDFFGEIKDPALNHFNTVRYLADNNAKMTIFSEIAKDKSLFFDAATDATMKRTIGEIVEVSKRGDKMAWGAIADKYTTPEMAEYLGGLAKYDNVYDATFKDLMGIAKKIKTSQNIPTHIRNFLGNVDFAVVGGISPTNPLNAKYYNHSKKILLGNDEILRREAVQDGIIGTELPGVELVNQSHEMFNMAMEGKSLYSKAKRVAIKTDRGLTKAYEMEDQFFKLAKYLKSREELIAKAGGVEKISAAQMKQIRRDAASEVYKYFPNYAEVSRFAKNVRESGALSTLMPFFSFKSESHRIFMNIIKNGTPAERAKLVGVLGWRATYNLTAMLAKRIPLGTALGLLWKNNQVAGSLADPNRPTRKGLSQRGIMPFDNYLPSRRSLEGNLLTGPFVGLFDGKGISGSIKGSARNTNKTIGASVAAIIDKDPSKLWEAILPFRQEEYK